MTAKEWLKAYREHNGTILMEEMFKEAEKLIEEMETLETQLSSAQNDNAKYCEMLAKADIEIRELSGKIKNETDETAYLKGQIEAYQYCMNCRR